MGGNLRGGYNFKAGNTTIAQLANSIGLTSTTPVQAGAGFTAKVSGVIRTSFYLGSNSGGTAYAQVYKNGVAHGTLRSTTASAGSPVQFIEDVFVEANGVITFRIWQPGGGMCTISSANILIENPTYSVA